MAIPNGAYTNVRVYAINHGPGSLANPPANGTALGGTFSTGPFSPNDLPSTETKFWYKITATDAAGHSVEFVPLKCIHAGGTSDFQE